MNDTIQQAQPGLWTHGTLPDNVRAGANSVLTGERAFKRFRSRCDPALIIGAYCTMDGVQFALGEEGRVEIGEYCYFTSAILLCEQELRIGSYVAIGWNAVIADTDFHPLGPMERIADAVACSPLGKGHARPVVERRPVIIEDNVWIGPSVTILKGVRIGPGAFIEAGTVLTRDVPSRRRVRGNPAQIIGEV
jgi:acetyltransferase-like isoleucine patch superfamily enzyme